MRIEVVRELVRAERVSTTTADPENILDSHDVAFVVRSAVIAHDGPSSPRRSTPLPRG
jgi:hypothetical protein